MATLFGIKNCDTVKKARRWLEGSNLDYQFHDFKLDGIDADTIKGWEKRVAKDTLINRRSTTWKQLSDAEKASFDGESLSPAALKIVIANPTLVKRPVLQHDKHVLVGFKEPQYSDVFK